MLVAVDLFGGAGGLALGAARSGFKTSAIVESSAAACSTLLANQRSGLWPFCEWQVFQSDVKAFEYRQREAIDLLTGGPPCQPFSIAGRGRGHSDGRDLFSEAARAVRELRPKCFVFENVKGLAFGRFASYLEYVRLRLTHPELRERPDEPWVDHLRRLEDYEMSGIGDGLRYRVLHRVLDAADYGVPQRRERLFIVGFRSDLRVEWHFPIPTHSKASLVWSQRPGGEYWQRHPSAEGAPAECAPLKTTAGELEPPPWRTVRDAIGDLPDPLTSSTVLSGHDFRPGARMYPGHTGSEWDKPSKTIKAGVHGTAGGENMLRLPTGEVRYFTVREAARLQTFPDDMRFEGTWTQVMKQIGNAVPPLLAEALLTSVAVKLQEASLPIEWRRKGLA